MRHAPALALSLATFFSAAGAAAQTTCHSGASLPAGLVCGPRRVTLVMQRQGDAVLVLSAGSEVARTPTPTGQRATGAGLHRF